MKTIQFFLLLTAYCLLPTSSDAQVTFQKTFEGLNTAESSAVQQTTDGGYIVVGLPQVFGAGQGDVDLIKIDANGNTLWTRSYAVVGDDYGWAVEQTTDGGYIVAGETGSFGGGFGDVYLIKTDSLGDTLWTRSYRGGIDNHGFAVEQTTDGGYIVAGYTGTFPNYDVYLIKTDTNGDTLWTRTYGGGGGDYGYAVEQTTDGGYIVAGGTNSFGAGLSDMYLIKTDSIGDTLWTKTYGGVNSDWAYAVEQTTDGGYIVAGNTKSFGAGDYDVYLIKTDSIGDTLWTRTYGGGSGDRASAVQQTTDGGYIVAGSTGSFGAGSSDVYLIKTDANGDTLWTKTYGGGSGDWASAVQQTNDGGYIMTGHTHSFGGGVLYLIKTDSNGNTGCNEMGTQTIVSGGAIVSSTDSTIIGSGAIVNSTATVVTSPSIIVSTLCVPPVANFIASDTMICKGDCINFFDLSTSSPTSWQWSFPGATPSSSTAQNPTNICYDTAGIYDVQLIATNATDSDTLLKTIYIQVDSCPLPPPTANFTGSDTMICEGDCINFTDLSTDTPTSWQWSFPGGISSTSTSQNPTNICYDTPGIYDVELIATNTNGSDTLIKTGYIQVDSCPPPTADFTVTDTMICEGDCINFADLSADTPASWQWSFPGAIPSTSTSQNPTNICYNDTGVFDVQLIATNANGSDTLTIDPFIVVENCDTPALLLDTILFIPNSFSPNEDGVNDVLFVRGSGIKNIKLFIYNRWGEKVFETNDIKNGWNGTYRGKSLNTGIFAWYAEIGFSDDNKVYRKGNVTLIK